VTAANSANRSKGFGRSGKGAFGSKPPPGYSASSLHIREVQKDFNEIEAILPAVLRSEAVWTVYVKEIKVCINILMYEWTKRISSSTSVCIIFRDNMKYFEVD
jgi:hypothetical protein